MWGWKIKPQRRGICQRVLGYRAWKRGLWAGTLTSEKELRLPSAGNLWVGVTRLILKSVEQSSDCICLPLWERKCYWQKKREISGVLFTATTSSQKVNRKVQATFFSQSLASSLPLVPFISWVPQVAEKSCSIKKQSRRMDLWFKKKKEKNYWQVCYLFHKKGKIRCA